ncbi:MAG: hypothetical protein KBF78_06635 [Fuscovulum sp.]|nr:hypothetical protein [Fuscovulum sp.]
MPRSHVGTPRKGRLAWLGLLFLPLACQVWGHTATAIPQEGLAVTYTVAPMFGWHSDWTRTITVSFRGSSIRQDLFEDTGWWRGSHLYRHISGAYVIHEGQAGCFAFTVDPLSFAPPVDISCLKNPSASSAGGTASKYYADMTYLGAFVETHAKDGPPIAFIPADQAPEVELPDVL